MQNYTIEIDSSTELDILEDLKKLTTVNTGGAVTEFPDNSFHTALLETQAYVYRQLVRYLQYAPLHIVAAYLSGVLGVPARTGSDFVKVQVSWTAPVPQTFKIFAGTEFANNDAGTLRSSTDLIVPQGTTNLQLNLNASNGVVKVGDALSSYNLLDATIVVISIADTNSNGLEGWDSYLERVSNVIAATPQYTLQQIVSLLRLESVEVLGSELVRGGGFEVFVAPVSVQRANTVLNGLSNRYNSVVVSAAEVVNIYKKGGLRFDFEQLRLLNKARSVSKCVAGEDVYVDMPVCAAQFERGSRYLIGDLVKTGTNYQVCTRSSNYINSVVGLAANGYGRLVRFDTHTSGSYSVGAGYVSNGLYYMNTNNSYVASPRPGDIVTTVSYVNGSYPVGTVLVQAGWGVVLNSPVTVPITPDLSDTVPPIKPRQGQSIEIGAHLMLNGGTYYASEGYVFNYSTPLERLTRVVQHVGLLSQPLYSRYKFGDIAEGTYYNGETVVSQPVVVRPGKLFEDNRFKTASNSYSVAVDVSYMPLNCDTLVLADNQIFA